MDEEDFFRILHNEYQWVYFNEGFLRKTLEKRLQNNTEYKKNLEDKEGILKVSWFSDLSEQIKEDIDLLDKINNLSRKDLIRSVLKYDRIEVKSKKDFIEIAQYTTMHNSYDDMSALLQEIVLYFMFEGMGRKIKCERIDY